MSDQDDLIEHVEVAVATPEGTWPTEGFFVAPATQSVRRQLQHAVRELQIADTSGWIAKANRKLINVDGSFEQNRLRGRVVIRYGPAPAGKRSPTSRGRR